MYVCEPEYKKYACRFVFFVSTLNATTTNVSLKKIAPEKCEWVLK